MTRLIRPAVLLAALALTGCGEKTTEVSGKVTYKGKPVTSGVVTILDGGSAPKAGAIQPDGTFRVSGVRLGTYKVAVSSPPPPGSEPARRPAGGRDADDDKVPTAVAPASPEVIKTWVALPEKYGDPAKSDLTVDVKAGQSLDIDLQ